MYYAAPDGRIYDDGRGMVTAPAYGLTEYNERYELPEPSARALTEQFLREQGRGLGDMVAAATGAVGIKPCSPCKRRQEILNRFGQRVANFAGHFYGR